MNLRHKALKNQTNSLKKSTKLPKKKIAKKDNLKKSKESLKLRDTTVISQNCVKNVDIASVKNILEKNISFPVKQKKRSIPDQKIDDLLSITANQILHTPSKSKCTLISQVKEKSVLSKDKSVRRKTYDSPNLNNCPIDDIAITPNSFAIIPNSFVRSFKSSKMHHTSTPYSDKQTSGKVKKKLSKSSILSSNSSSKKTSRGTLKEKRSLINTLKERNEGYEDDIFESEKFGNFKEVIEMDDNDSDTSMQSIDTPKCIYRITPKMPLKTPRYKDCYSPLEWLKNRKIAEEVMVRRNQRRKNASTSSSLSAEKINSAIELSVNESSDNLPEKKRLEFQTLFKNISETQKQPKINYDGEKEQDENFSDVSS